MDLQKKVRKFLTHVFVRKQHHRGWVVSATVLLVIFAGVVTYSFQTDFQSAVNGLLWGTQQPGVKKFKVPVTVIYNENSQEQKDKMELFLANLSDPTTALKDTELQPIWLDIGAQSLDTEYYLGLSKLHYLPQIFLDGSVAQHPQFDKLKQYLNKAGDFYFMRLAPLEHLAIPPATEGYAVGADIAKAKVVIQAYESYLSQDAATANETLKKVLKNYPDTVAVVYKHFEPEDLYNQLAQAAECAADQKKFIQMQDAIFKGQTPLLAKLQAITDVEEALVAARKQTETYAKNLGLKFKDFQACLDAKTYAKTIDAQTLSAIDYGIKGPPAFFVNKEFHDGLLSYDEFKTIIDQEIK